MKEFTLHDGEDEEKTDELHKFLESMGDNVFDWDGDESGISLMINVRVNIGDTILYDESDGTVTIRRKQQS